MMKTSLKSGVIALVALAGSTSAPVAAQDAAPPPNNVTCVFEAIGPEMQENAQFLLVGSIRRGRSMADSPDLKEELEAIISEAYNYCLDLYPWTSGESANAQLYAMMRIVGGSMTEAMRENGDDPDLIDTYFDQNLSRLGKQTRLSAVEKTKLHAFLEAQGWDLGKQGLASMAASRLELAMVLNQLNRGFRLNQFY